MSYHVHVTSLFYFILCVFFFSYFTILFVLYLYCFYHCFYYCFYLFFITFFFCKFSVVLYCVYFIITATLLVLINGWMDGFTIILHEQSIVQNISPKTPVVKFVNILVLTR